MHDQEAAPPRKRIAATIIYGGGDDEGLARCLKSIDPHVDGIFIAFNGAGDLPPASWTLNDGKPLTSPISIDKFEWEDDFGKARNQAFEMVPKDEYDWMFWIDTDDTLEGGENIQPMLAELKPETQGIFLRYDYGVDPQTGRVLVVQWRERFMRTDGRWKWQYPIHEVCHAVPGTQYARKEEVWFKHWREKGAEDSATRERNRRILVKAHKENPNEKRHVFYLANEIYAEADHLKQQGVDREDEFLAAIEMYQQFLAMSGFDDDAYTANHRIAECFRAIGDHNKAIDADLQGIKLMPHWPDSWVGVAISYLDVEQWEKVRFFADAAIKLTSMPDTTHAIEPLNLEYMPFLLRGLANQQLGALRMALMDMENAQVANPTSVVKNRIEMLKAVLEEQGTATEAPPDKRSATRGTRTDRSVAIVNRPSFEVWHPEQERQGGAGGAETCVMKLAPRLAEAGWRVAVFGTPGEYEGIDSQGVEWWDVREFDATERFHTIIGSRSPELFDTNLDAEQKILWMHDVNSSPEAFESEWGNRLGRIDKVVALTEWHRNHLMRLYDIPYSQMEVIGNGIDPHLFPSLDQRPARESGPNFVYSSSPDRGLDVVLGLWGSIRDRYKDAQLHVFYGWEAIDKIRAHQQTSQGSAHYLGQFKADVEAQLDAYGREKAGIFWHGRVPQEELYRQLQSMDIWLYPTYFLETFCITALEMQMAGVIPLVNKIGALDETVALDVLKLYGYPNNTSFRDQYLDRLWEILDSKPDWDSFQDIGRDHAAEFSWEAQAEQWLELLNKVREPV